MGQFKTASSHHNAYRDILILLAFGIVAQFKNIINSRYNRTIAGSRHNRIFRYYWLPAQWEISRLLAPGTMGYSNNGLTPSTMGYHWLSS